MSMKGGTYGAALAFACFLWPLWIMTGFVVEVKARAWPRARTALVVAWRLRSIVESSYGG